jgi:P27 family predicted phage terminase small subunit
LNKTGLIIKTTNGNIIQNPLVGIANKAWGEYLRFAQEFGLTPASRTRIQAPEETDEDEFLTFMAGAMNKANYG